jgi:endonuclease/exonuclease/phosphatase family metal-dependent hydrolase
MITSARLCLAAALAATVVLVPSVASAQDDQESASDQATLTVMARNLYLGADAPAALELLPDTRGAMQFMWDQVPDTDFDTRATRFVEELARYSPDVVGLQEATVWSCRKGLFGELTPVYDFTAALIQATREAGIEYVVAEAGGDRANNPGYEIPAVPYLTTVTDPDTFQPLFGSDTADCGFTIGDALLVRADLADAVQAAGTSEFEDRYAAAPVVFEIDRGYAWADLAIAGTTVRVVTTHLESLWSEGEVTVGALQAQQLVQDLADTTVPLIVAGDVNSDPRDPRESGAQNPAEQPVESDVCPAQPADPTLATADPTCNAFWTMLNQGYEDAGPDPFDPAFYTWGSAADLAGPDADRLRVALELGNASGFTERLDHVFVTNGARVVESAVIGNVWPDGDDVWECSDETQVATTEEASAIQAEAGVGEAITGRGVCLPTDHAGLVTTVDVSAGPTGVVAQPAPDSHESFRLSLLGWIGVIVGVLLLLVVLLVVGVVVLVRRRRRRRRQRQTQPADSPTG